MLAANAIVVFCLPPPCFFVALLHINDVALAASSICDTVFGSFSKATHFVYNRTF